MFGLLGYGYEYFTGSDLGEDLVAGSQYVYDTTTGAIYDAGSAALETAGDIYDTAAELPTRAADTFTEQSGIDAATAYLEGLQDSAERVGKVVRTVAIGAGVAAAGLLAYALLGKK